MQFTKVDVSRAAPSFPHSKLPKKNIYFLKNLEIETYLSFAVLCKYLTQAVGRKNELLNCPATFAISQSASITCLVISVNELPVIDRVSHYATVFLLQWTNKAVDRPILPSKLKSNRRNRLGCCVSRIYCCSTPNIRRRVRHNAMILASVDRSFKALQLFFLFRGHRISRSFANSLKLNRVQAVPPSGQFDIFQICAPQPNPIDSHSKDFS